MEQLGVCSAIPKIVHQIWLGEAKPPLEWMNTWKDFCNKYNWEYKLWTDVSIKNFGLKNKIYYDKAKSYQKKADIARYEIVYRYGGLYCDCDMVWLGKDLSKYIPLDKNMFIGVQEYPSWIDIGTPYLCNGFFISPVRHNILRRCIDKISSDEVNLIDMIKGDWSQTGPVLLNNSIKEGIIILPYTHVFPKDFHYKQGIKDPCQFKDNALVFTYNGMEYPHLKNKSDISKILFIVFSISVILVILVIFYRIKIK